MFIITPLAAQRIREAADQSGQDLDAGTALRIAAKIDEEGQMEFGMGFDEERQNDLSIECGGIPVLIAPPSQDLLSSFGLDCSEDDDGEWQFVFFHHENADAPSCSSGQGGSSSCGGCSGGSCA